MRASPASIRSTLTGRDVRIGFVRRAAVKIGTKLAHWLQNPLCGLRRRYGFEG